MLDTQSTFALPNRLTQIALYPNLNQYLRDVDNEGKSLMDSPVDWVHPWPGFRGTAFFEKIGNYF